MIGRYAPTVGAIVVLRGLRMNQNQPTSSLIGSRIGEVGQILTGGRFLVHLAMGYGNARRFSSRGRVVLLENIEREATPRERQLGFVTDAAPAADRRAS